MVEVVGTGAQYATFDVRNTYTSRSKFRSLALTGPNAGVGTLGASDEAAGCGPILKLCRTIPRPRRSSQA
ncbi:hypothetical protein [Sorangium sp. So ce887]|uniref:hypothetical protein n=1 Tax=Sorangium sp. So ce887 TaxID=3133324 RepID=UPI003F5E3162